MSSREIPLLKPSYQMSILDAIEKDPEGYKKMYTGEKPWMDEEESCQGGSGISVPEDIGLVLDPGQTLAWNAKALHQALIHLTQTQASNPFLWGRLCHFECWDWMLSRRWPENDKKKTTQKHIQEAFFMYKRGSRYLTRNALSKLWWIAHYTHVRGGEYEHTEILTDMPEIMERSYGRCKEVVRPIVRFFAAKKSAITDKEQTRNFRNRFARPVLKALNRHGAVSLLSNESAGAIKDFLEAEHRRVEERLREQEKAPAQT
jgi:hypothetical protein